MSISSQTRKTSLIVGNDTSTSFSFAFKVFATSDLLVTIVNTSTSLETALTLTTDYSITLNSDQNANAGGTVEFNAGLDIDGTGLHNGTLPVGFNLVISSQVAYLQGVDLTNQGGFYPRVINDALDKLTIQTQQLKEEVGRSAKLSITNPADATTLNTAINRIASSIDEVDTVAQNIDTIVNVNDNITDIQQAVADAITVTDIYDQFDDRYLGTKTTNPTVDNDGNALLVGALFYKDVVGSEGIYSWTGTNWIPQSLYRTGLNFTLDGRGSGLEPGDTVTLACPFDCIITSYQGFHDTTNTTSVTFEKQSFVGFDNSGTWTLVTGLSFPVDASGASTVAAGTFGTPKVFAKGDIIRMRAVSTLGNNLCAFTLFAERT